RLVRGGHLITEHVGLLVVSLVYGRISAVNSDQARPSHGSTTPVPAPRRSTTSTLAPFGNGSSDHARKASLDPRTVTNTSPAPRSPLVATVRVPTQPMAEASLT